MPAARMSVIIAMLITTTCQAAEFAIETDVFSGRDLRPQAKNLTVFAEDGIYDFSQSPKDSVTVFDPTAKRFTIADGKSRKKASLAVDELVRFIATARARAENLDIELLKFAKKPQFEVSYDDESGDLEMVSDVWTYRVETISVDPNKLAKYNEFARWYTQLNALFRPIPPSIRMELNQELARRNRFPTRVQVEILRNGKVVVRQESRHRLVRQLKPEHKTQLEEWRKERGGYRLIPFVDYRAGQLPVAASSSGSEKQ